MRCSHCGPAPQISHMRHTYVSQDAHLHPGQLISGSFFLHERRVTEQVVAIVATKRRNDGRMTTQGRIRGKRLFESLQCAAGECKWTVLSAGSGSSLTVRKSGSTAIRMMSRR